MYVLIRGGAILKIEHTCRVFGILIRPMAVLLVDGVDSRRHTIPIINPCVDVQW